ncbi:alpha/beta hydrolase [Pelagibius litoralis]|uniref:Alpha/beta hydrolase n=2 Tax=Pelagibius litoralis TaxID=374515 RepID=A0A967C1U2_9PROT|nr:alpha/beta hydrolase [Pelagibius litoralis]
MTRSRPTRLLLCCLLLALGACAPRLAPPGPGLQNPESPVAQISGDRFVTADGLTLPLRSWEPPADKAPHGVILALHGFNDYSEAFSLPGPALAQAGLLVYAYDQRGFGTAPHTGLWAGIDRLTGDLSDAAALLQERHPDLPLFLLGESMGGAVVLAALAGANPPQAEGVILAAPAVWARSTMPFSQRAALWLGARLFPWARFSGSGLGIQASDNIEMLRGLGRDPLFIKKTRVDAIYGLVNLMDAALQAAPSIDQDALLLYGERDEVVPAEPTYALWRSLPPEAAARQRRALYAEGWHMLLRDLQAGVVIDDIAAWTRDRQAPLPSQAEAYAAAALAKDGGTADPETENATENETAAAGGCAAPAC